MYLRSTLIGDMVEAEPLRLGDGLSREDNRLGSSVDRDAMGEPLLSLTLTRGSNSYGYLDVGVATPTLAARPCHLRGIHGAGLDREPRKNANPNAILPSPPPFLTEHSR